MTFRQNYRKVICNIYERKTLLNDDLNSTAAVLRKKPMVEFEKINNKTAQIILNNRVEKKKKRKNVEKRAKDVLCFVEYSSSQESNKNNNKNTKLKRYTSPAVVV